MGAPVIKLKRAYDAPAKQDGRRFLVDRVWPRGVKKDVLELEDWLKAAAPSAELRKWFNHDPARWSEFQQRYRDELAAHVDALEPLIAAARRGDVTLVYGARDTEHNQAVVLKGVLEEQLGRTS